MVFFISIATPFLPLVSTHYCLLWVLPEQVNPVAQGWSIIGADVNIGIANKSLQMGGDSLGREKKQRMTGFTAVVTHNKLTLALGHRADQVRTLTTCN